MGILAFQTLHKDNLIFKMVAEVKQILNTVNSEIFAILRENETLA